MACLSKIDEFGAALLNSVGQKVGARAIIETYTEIVFEKQLIEIKDRPDGLIVLKVGKREWRALVEAKVGTNVLDIEQIEKYRALAKDNNVDCVITISNQFATNSAHHPLEAIRKSRSKIPVFHWSWMHILTVADLLISQDNVDDMDQLVLLNELRRFLGHESAGVKGYDRMPKEWSNLNKLVSTGADIPAKSSDANIVLEAWHQEMRDLTLILSRLTETSVSEKLPQKHLNNPSQRIRDEMDDLRHTRQLKCVLNIPDTASPIEIIADITRRSINVGMTLRAPEDKKTTKARMNWLLRQIRSKKVENIYVRLLWPGKSEATQFSISELRDNINIINIGKEHLTVHGFHVFSSNRIGVRFIQQVNFISDLEKFVPFFYKTVGSSLNAWKRSPPKIKSEKTLADDVSPEAIADEADGFQPKSIFRW